MRINTNILIMDKIIFIAGGGTGGHLFPALSIGNALIDKGFSIVYIGSKFGIEEKYFKKYKHKHYLLNIKGIQRNLSIKSITTNIFFPFRFLVSYILSLLIIKKYMPIAIIGTGGYASGLPLIVGSHLNIPIMIQEQNSIPGIITKIIHKKAKKIFLGYEYSKKIFNNTNSIYTGNPIRNDLKILDKNESKVNLRFNINKKLILIIGGSQGARPINAYILKHINFFIENDFQILWQVGSSNFNEIVSRVNHKNIKIEKFIYNMSQAYSAADLVISRAGAIAISELTFFEKAMILIPLPSAANNHQNINANYLNKRNACIIINQKDFEKEYLQKSILNLFQSKNKIKNLEKNSKLLSMPKATEKIVNEIINIIR